MADKLVCTSLGLTTTHLSHGFRAFYTSNTGTPFEQHVRKLIGPAGNTAIFAVPNHPVNADHELFGATSAYVNASLRTTKTKRFQGITRTE